jgi:DNA-directed RNA polymerase subunit RPC12/RpoP
MGIIRIPPSPRIYDPKAEEESKVEKPVHKTDYILCLRCGFRPSRTDENVKHGRCPRCGERLV